MPLMRVRVVCILVPFHRRQLRIHIQSRFAGFEIFDSSFSELFYFLFLFSSSLLGEWCGLFGWHTDIVIHKSLGTPLTAHSYYWMSALTCDFYVRCRAEHIKYNVWFDGVSRAYHQWESYAILFTDSLMYMRRIEKIKFHFMGKSSPFAKGIAMQWHFSTPQAFLHPHQSDVIYILFRLSNRLLFILDANDA